MEDQPPTGPFREIGRGCCGSVWASEASNWVLKREDGDKNRSIRNDQIMHRTNIAVAKHDELWIRIPKSYEIIEANDPWWADNITQFPNLEPCRSYRQERIPAVPKEVRDVLIERYCREDIQATAKASQNNADCLLRIYAGRRSDGRRRAFFNLRNYGLQVDQIEQLELDARLLVEVLAKTLAYCYWRAKVDAHDVEFVLAPATEPTYTATKVFTIEGVELVIWMLDFDCVRKMSTDEAGIQQAVQAFYQNDPYFPRPYFSGMEQKDRQLWTHFKECFLKASEQVLEQQDKELPSRWVALIEEEGERRRIRAGAPQMLSA